MADSARIVFVSFASQRDPLRESWRRFREAVAPATGADLTGAGRAPGSAAPTAGGDLAGSARAAGHPSSSGETSGVWRLLATNNRELCRAAFVYPTFAGARAHVLALRARADELETVAIAGPAQGSRGWYLTLDGAIVATCGRWYGASAAGGEAAAAALEAFGEAVIGDIARDLSPRTRNRAPRVW
ncbi:hypothetical protein [Herbiconiux liangxiaofengii]|uniref:hypothetical protein n=1 Tax=Herbiconiux liangxiaofengii TaxID=3342795 RepID=UPI0035B70430